MLRLVTLLTIASAAFAAPTPTPAIDTVTLVDAFRALRRDQLAVDKRQLLSDGQQDALSGLQDLLERAATSVTSGGQCESECTGWISKMIDCYDSSSSYVAIGRCACTDSTLSPMEDCGSCFGSSSRTDATDFRAYCDDANGALSSASSRATSTTSSSSSLSRGISGSAFASGTSSARSGSATPTPTGGSFGGLNDIGSSVLAGDEVSSALRPSASGASNGQSVMEGGGNAAGTVKVGVALVAGLAGGVAAVLAL
ncbi:hypothetical protein JCM8097_006804 [Rhodosporidiobolus ruineniae]